ncbi:hypothetical protein K461DRAFT_158935 [Myriangium duriaei CBS 260.36]|uniref:Uncharacterized protein n=1 Tax=Myriangium duriaei CBS 260.36 TaxID=1168546 RepID=A0A9P4J056_9PEZI|nr:hypothetical protein K461DRAFT_158935 [Myriangium duriaei CBS 260.36]
MLCIKQRSDWSLIKTNAQRPRTSYKDASAIGFMQSSMIKRAYEAVYGKPKHIAKVIPQFQSSLDPDKIKALYRYAQKSWIQSNRHLRADSWTSWNMFCKLAAERHYGVQYPWLRFQTSHLHGLFCWAVTHGHIALMELVINEPHLRAAKKIDLFNKPLLPPDGGFALHYAARSGNTEVFLRLFDHVDVFKLDNNGDTALHLGAQTGQRIVTACYTRSSILPFITHSRPHWKNSSGQNPLHMAMLSANLACVSDVMDVSKVKVPKLPCTVLECWHNAKDNNNDKPFDLAMTHGDIDFLQSCFELYVKKKIGLPPMTSVLRTSVRLQNWDLLEYLISRSDIPADTCPFDAENEFPDLSAPIARHLMELIFKRRENWIPQLLVDSWNAGTEDFRNLILSMMPDLYEHSNPHNHFIFLEICRNIKRSTITCSSPLSRPGESISLSWPKISHHDDVGKLWATFVALEAVVANDLGALRFALSKEAEIPAILLYEAICTGNEEIKDCVIKHLPKDKRLSRSVRRGAVAIAEERRKPMVQSELIALVQTVNRGLYAEVTE